MPRTVMSSIMRSRSALTGECEGWDVIGKILSSRRLQDLRCSGADAPIVTPERSSPHRGHREHDDLQARPSPARAGSFSGPKPKWWNVRFCAAVGGQADIKRASSGSADL